MGYRHQCYEIGSCIAVRIVDVDLPSTNGELQLTGEMQVTLDSLRGEDMIKHGW